MIPIVLNTYGEMLREYPSDDRRKIPNAPSDEDERKELSTCVGVHAFCGGWVDFTRISETHSTIVCRSCHTRLIVFPASVKTYGDLRAFCGHTLGVSQLEHLSSITPEMVHAFVKFIRWLGDPPKCCVCKKIIYERQYRWVERGERGDLYPAHVSCADEERRRSRW